MKLSAVFIVGILILPATLFAEKKDDTVDFVQAFLKVETGQIPPKLIPRFMDVDAAVLPEKMRPQFEAKKTELEVLQKIAAGKKKWGARRAGKDPIESCGSKKKSATFIAYMKQMGFFEITAEEVEMLEKKTKCNFCELAEEFSFTPVIKIPKKKKNKKKGKEKNVYLLHMKDPLEAYVGQYRQTGNVRSSTNFFGASSLSACH
jgi:hypothetical protein